MCYHLRSEVWEIEVEPHKNSLNLRFSLKKLIAEFSGLWFPEVEPVGIKGPSPHLERMKRPDSRKELTCWWCRVFVSRESVFCLLQHVKLVWLLFLHPCCFCQVRTHPSPAVSFAAFTVCNFCCHSLTVHLLPFASSLPSHLREESLALTGNTSQCSYSCPCVLY